MPQKKTDSLLQRMNPVRMVAQSFAKAVVHRMQAAQDSFLTPKGNGMERSILGQLDRTLTSAQLATLNEWSFRVYSSNPIARRIIEVITHFVGSEVTITAKNNNKAVQDELDEFWFNARNNMPLKIPAMTRDFSIFGEVVPIFIPDIYTGRTTIGFIDQRAIEGVVRNQINWMQIEKLQVRLSDGQLRDFAIIREERIGERAKNEIPHYYSNVPPDKLVGKWVGEVDLWSLNTLISSTRSYGDLVQCIDVMRAASDLVEALRIKAQLQNSCVWDVKVPKNTTEEQMKVYRNPQSPFSLELPSDPGGLWLHTENVEGAWRTPTLGAAENKEVFDMLMMLIESGSGLPHYIFGQGGDVNRATALEMGGPLHRWLSARQKLMEHYIRRMCKTVIDNARIFSHRLDAVSEEELDVEVTLPELAVKDDQTRTQSLQTKIAAIISAFNAKQITHKQSLAMTKQAFADAGVEMPDDVEPVLDPDAYDGAPTHPLAQGIA